MYELLENSLQHAFIDQAKTANFVEVSLKISDPMGPAAPQYLLSVADSGAGFAASIFAAPDTSGGLGFVRYISDSYSGSLDVDLESGTRVSFTLPTRTQD